MLIAICSYNLALRFSRPSRAVTSLADSGTLADSVTVALGFLKNINLTPGLKVGHQDFFGVSQVVQTFNTEDAASYER